MKRIVAATALVSLVLFAACLHHPAKQNADATFQRLSSEFLTNYFQTRPLSGVALGLHKYDGDFVVPDQKIIAAEREQLKSFARKFKALSDDELSIGTRNDLRLITLAIRMELWAGEQQQVFRHNPMAYFTDVSHGRPLDISIYLQRDWKPLPERVADIASILLKTPAQLSAAESNLERILPRPFVETAILSARATADFLEKDVAQAAAKVPDAGIRSGFNESNQPAIAAFRKHADWLEKERLPLSDNSFALGRDKYVAMLKGEMVGLTPERILEIGLAELQKEKKRFADAAAVIDSSRKATDVFRDLQRDHPTAEALISDTRRDLDKIRQFVIDHHLVTIPSEIRPRVQETLPPFRATTFASMDTPGPFEKKATEAYYYVTPVEPDWSKEKAEEWLTSFNYYELDDVSIHEAYPGHYAQFLVLNASKASDISKIFASYAFVEGWAHYAEQMMVEEGFGQPANRASASREEEIRGAKYRLAQSSEALLRLCRLCCSIKLHCQGMTVDEATRFFMENSYFEEKPARSEAMRGTFDPGYLYYTLGKLMILKLRRDWQQQEGESFTLLRFHDELLSHGAPPIPLLREMMLKDSRKWKEIL
jgi:uncharacterized protein (DUF885 family)